MSNSLEQVLSVMKQGRATLGWSAVAIYSRERLNRLLQQQYNERLHELRYLPPFTTELATAREMLAARKARQQPQVINAVQAQQVEQSKLRLTVDIDTVGAQPTARISQAGASVKLQAIEFGTPVLSFSNASVSNSRARLSMNIVGGSCTAGSRADSRMFSVFTLNEAMGYSLEMDIDLALVRGSVDHTGRVTLDLSKGSKFSCNLYAEDAQLNGALVKALQAWFRQMPSSRSRFELGVLNLDGHSPLKPQEFIIRTQAAPGAGLRNAQNYGDGAVLVFIRVQADAANGGSPSPSYPYLLPDGNYSATVVLAKRHLDYATEERLVLLNSLLFPADYEFIERSRYTPHDLAIFGNINPQRTRFTVEPNGQVIGADEKLQFKLLDGEGREVSAHRWRAVGLKSHTAASQGVISPNGLYRAASHENLGHEVLPVVVTAEYDEAGETYRASARLLVSFERLQMMPRVISLPPEHEQVPLSAWGAGNKVQWQLDGVVAGALTVIDDQSAAFQPDAERRKRTLLAQHVVAKDGDVGSAALLMVNAQQLLGVEPNFVPRLKSSTSHQLNLSGTMLPHMRRRWRVLSGPGEVDQHGRFTASAERTTRTSAVVCEAVHNGVIFATDYSLVEQSELVPEKTWQSLAKHGITVPGGAEMGSKGALYGNGFQQMPVKITVQTSRVDGEYFPLSVNELASIVIADRVDKQNVEMMPETSEGLEDEAVGGVAWALRTTANQFQSSVGALAEAAQEDILADEQFQTFYLHGRSRSSQVREFVTSLQKDSGEWFSSDEKSGLENKIEVTTREVPFFSDGDYRFIGYRVDGGGQGQEVPQKPDDDEFYLHPKTVDYWKLQYPQSPFMSCEVVSDSDNDSTPPLSTLAWESEHDYEEYCSYTGFIFEAPGAARQQSIVFHGELSKALGVESSLLTGVRVDRNIYSPGSVVISNHRTDNISFAKSDPKIRETLKDGIQLALRDKQGNPHYLRMSYLPESTVGHRNHLRHVATPAAYLRAWAEPERSDQDQEQLGDTAHETNQ